MRLFLMQIPCRSGHHLPAITLIALAPLLGHRAHKRGVIFAKMKLGRTDREDDMDLEVFFFHDHTVSKITLNYVEIAH